MVSDLKWCRGVFWPPTRLNPCSNGIWSLTTAPKCFPGLLTVLILVLMEYGLWPSPKFATIAGQLRLNPCSNGIWSLTVCHHEHELVHAVLILVLMEYGLWRTSQYLAAKAAWCLNPCSNGIWSLTDSRFLIDSNTPRVLILVLMEYGLWHAMASTK